MHCCPQGTTCSSTGKCYRDGILTDWFTKIPATVRSDVRPVQEVTCKDGSMCQDGETCCLMASGKYGCCPCVEVMSCIKVKLFFMPPASKKLEGHIASGSFVCPCVIIDRLHTLDLL